MVSSWPYAREIQYHYVAPVVPFVGAFIAVVGWSYRKSLAYIVLGGAAKYTFLLVLVGYLGIVYDPGTATWITVAAVLILVGVSVGAATLYRRRAAVPPGGAA